MRPARAGAVLLEVRPRLALSGLAPGTTYYMRCRAWNEAGAGAWSTARILAVADVPEGFCVGAAMLAGGD